jgi:Outer membrane protein beta-barrel domain
MKKVFVLVAALLVCFVVTAQVNRVPQKKSSSFSFNIGPSIPVSDFASTNYPDNDGAGYAITGVNLNVNYDYMFERYIGITFDLFYGSHKLKNQIVEDYTGDYIPNVDISHYEYVGLLGGPVLTGTLSPKANINFKLLGGIGRSRSPGMDWKGEIYVKEDWATAFAWRINSDVRFTIADNLFLMFDVSYTQTRPEYGIIIGPHESQPENLQKEIHVSTINLNAGVGIRF